MKERFTPLEWAELEKLPLIVFLAVATADNKVDEAELSKLLAEFGDAARYRDPLHRELFVDLYAGDHILLLPATMEEIGDLSIPLLDSLGKRKDILHRHLSETEYQRFIFSLFGFGLVIAAVSGGTVDDEEANRLAIIGTAFGADLEAGRKALQALPGGNSSATSSFAPAGAGAAGGKKHWWQSRSH